VLLAIFHPLVHHDTAAAAATTTTTTTTDDEAEKSAFLSSRYENLLFSCRSFSRFSHFSAF
jgi:hypothetical protein